MTSQAARLYHPSGRSDAFRAQQQVLAAAAGYKTYTVRQHAAKRAGQRGAAEEERNAPVAFATLIVHGEHAMDARQSFRE
jgi:hypothetical protein